MADEWRLSFLLQGTKAWNDLKARPGYGGRADLSHAVLNGRDLSGADLRDANLDGANLRNAKLGPGTLLCNADFSRADLYQADLSGADLRDANFSYANVSEANLREADLKGARLAMANGVLRTEQLAGTDLTGAALPEQLAKLYDALENVKGISESARKLFLAVLAACLYCWLTIATTTDVNLITNGKSSPLPMIQTSIPIVGFYMVAPLLVLCVYFYFHFYLQKLWEELGSLPAIFPDGRPLHAKVDPWLLNDLVRAHLPRLSANRPFMSYFQLWISVLLAWWVVPVTMLLFWGRYLRRHEVIGTAFHVVLLVISIVAAVRLYRLAVLTLSGVERKAFTWKNALPSRRTYQAAGLTCVVGILFGLVSFGAIGGVRSSAPLFGFLRLPLSAAGRTVLGPRTWVPRWMALIGYPPFANFDHAEVSQKKPAWSEKKYDDPDSVIGAQFLEGADLRYASGVGAFLARADLHGADLSGAELSFADLSGAELAYARLSNAGLLRANLRGAHATYVELIEAELGGANLSGAYLLLANLSGAKLDYADLSFAVLDGARNLHAEQVKVAKNWDKAFYDEGMLKALGLPPDHNQNLAQEYAKQFSGGTTDLPYWLKNYLPNQ